MHGLAGTGVGVVLECVWCAWVAITGVDMCKVCTEAVHSVAL